ncbi:hypothetical protein GOPIP_025_00620 [Gordonia polyisoprenivorans NBRC 16320 = JCM 10675]|nr:hypothetical protein GOPIP_025_00620 [Gordonia polyisoprenivorans NBRC 16320 = JCM 10675]
MNLLMAPPGPVAIVVGMATSEIPQNPTTAAFFLQAAIAFGVSLATAVVGVFYLPIDAWQRGFLAITLLFLTSSTFTLAKVVRDRQEQTSVRARLDEARVDKLIAEHDPFSKVS